MGKLYTEVEEGMVSDEAKAAVADKITPEVVETGKGLTTEEIIVLLSESLSEIAKSCTILRTDIKSDKHERRDPALHMAFNLVKNIKAFMEAYKKYMTELAEKAKEELKKEPEPTT
jgi:hypothetical protein